MDTGEKKLIQIQPKENIASLKIIPDASKMNKATQNAEESVVDIRSLLGEESVTFGRMINHYRTNSDNNNNAILVLK